MAEAPEHSALLDLVDKIEQELHVRRRDILGRIAPVQVALDAYRRALEEHAAFEYATSHGLRRPDTAGLSKERAAHNLLATVQALPELAPIEESPAEGTGTPKGSAPSRRVELGGPQGEAESGAAPHTSRAELLPLSTALPRVAAACDTKKLVIVGALSGRRRVLPEPLEHAAEWIDTSDGGAHAIGNVPTRIRQGRIFGVVICDQAISHKHSEPLVAAARSVNVAVGFAGKGGGAGIGRALRSIEDQLESMARK